MPPLAELLHDLAEAPTRHRCGAFHFSEGHRIAGMP